MNINVNASSDANFNVLITDYGENSHMSVVYSQLTLLLHCFQTTLPDFSSAETALMETSREQRR